MPYTTVSFRMILSGLAKCSMIRSTGGLSATAEFLATACTNQSLQSVVSTSSILRLVD